MKFKEYEMPDGIKAVFEYDENGVGKITLECMDMLMGQLIAYKRCIQSRSFWDAKHCDDCIFYDDCPFNPREDEDEPNSSEKPNNCEHITEDGVTCAKYPACDDCLDNPLNKVKGSERLVKGSEQTDCLDRYDHKTEPTISKMEQVQ